MTDILDLSSLTVNIKFDKSVGIAGGTIYYIDENDTPIDLTGYSAEGVIKPSCDSDIVLLVLTSAGLTPNLTITNEAVTDVDPFSYVDSDDVEHVIPKPPLTTATIWGVRPNVPNSFTSTITWDSAYYEIRLVAPGGALIPFAKGSATVDCGSCC
jgi:hypothetical protein